MTGRVLVAVAHPDDESVWAAGYLSTHPGTHVCCASVPDKDPERIGDFIKACEVLKAYPFVVGTLSSLHDFDAAVNFAQGYDTIITHNHLGEYGHAAHRTLHFALRQLDKIIYGFNYGLETGEPIDADIKRKAIACYTTRPKVWENQSKHFDLTKECLIRY